jgi:tetratricopeptide (TPR) repeat protein
MGSPMEKTHKNLLVISAAILALFCAGCGLVDTIKARGLAREGNALYLKSDYHNAIEKYLQALDLDPDTPNLHLNLGYSYFSIYNPNSESEQDRRAAREAVKYFSEHLERHPADENARIFQIKTLLTAAPSDPELADRALKTFLKMLEKNPKDHEAHQYLITLFIDCRRYEDAVKFFEDDLKDKPDDIETMKILAIVADKSDQIQEAIEWYWRRAEVTEDQEKKATLFYEIGTYTWNMLHYQPDRVTGHAAIKIADQGIEACRYAMQLKEKYAEALVYANLLYLKRAVYETEEAGRTWDQAIAFELRVEAGKILGERKKKAEQAKLEEKQKDGTQEESPDVKPE